MQARRRLGLPLKRMPAVALPLLVGGGLLLCIVVQVWLSAQPALLVPALLLLCACGAATAALLCWSNDRPLTPPTVSTSGARFQPLVPVLGAIVGLVCAWIGASRVSDPWQAQLWWGAALVVPLLALIGERLAAWRRNRWKVAVDWRDVAFPALLFALALTIRVPDITAAPPFVHGDEAACGFYGRQFEYGQTPLLSISWFGLSMLSYAISGVGMHLLGDNLTGLRLTNAIIGSASVALLYLLGRELFGRWAGLLAGLILAITFLHVDLSRDGIHYVQGPTCVTLTLYLLVLWLRRGGALVAFLIGVCMIVDLQVYWSARVGPVLALCLLLFLAVRERHIPRVCWRESAWIALGLLAYGLPVAALFQANPGTFAGHDTGVSILTNDPGTLAHLRSEYGTTALLPILARQTWLLLTTFNFRGDASLQIGWSGAMLDTVSAALLPVAVLLALLRWRRWPYALVLAWFGAVAAAGIITIDPPWWPRLAALLPAVALLLGALFAEATRLLTRYALPYRRVAWGGLAGLLLCMAIGNARIMFVEYPAVASQTGTMEPTLLGRFLAGAPGAQHTVLLSDGSLYVDYVVAQFLAPRSGGCTLMPNQSLSQCPIARTSRLYMLLPGRLGDLAWLQRQRPGGRVIQVASYNNGVSRIIAYELPAEQAGRSAPLALNYFRHSALSTRDVA